MDQDMTAITTKEQLLAYTIASWEGLIANLDQISAAQWTEPKDAAGWSVKDHIAHITQWDRALIGQLRDGIPMQQTLGVPDAAWSPADFDAINESIRQITIDHTVAAVITDRNAIWRNLLALLHDLSEDQLAAPVSASGLAVGNTELTGSVLEELVQSLGIHYADHRHYIAAIVAGAE